MEVWTDRELAKDYVAIDDVTDVLPNSAVRPTANLTT